MLDRLLHPTPLPSPQSRAEFAREERSTLVETAKDRWNAEVENAVRWVQRTDWNDMRESIEGSAARLLGGGLQKSRDVVEEAEKAAAPKFKEAIGRSKAAAQKSADRAAIEIDHAAAKMIRGAERAGVEAKEEAGKIAAAAKNKLSQAGVKADEARDAVTVKTERFGASAKAGGHDATEAVKHSGGTIDAARGAVRDAVSKGIEKGKEAIGKAQAIVGLASETIESRGQSAGLSHSSVVERALHERYQQPTFHEKSVEETLAERYTEIDSRDNTRLRGV
ncbi:hypothetical protein ONS95_003160 [Cadophora gregata]|uniref:uncharacterized protein n=1 Tax=Cadophora gregata TaxID=51156 RepID=UPI0026DDAE44|nr:uncharacterized protein ONS95_003160 [Cadophora gregata]KAK0108345.1 hypothetical protein ONS95_003160 [Cadophora gregata]